MAEEEKEEEGAAVEEASGAAAGGSKLPLLQLILMVVNTLALGGTLFYFIKTRLTYTRPPIVEEEELMKKKEELKSPAKPTDPELIPFDELTVNIAMTSGKAHFATVTLVIECSNKEVARVLNMKKSVALDRLIALLGKRQITELSTIQGKLLLKTELLQELNKIVSPEGTAALSSVGRVEDIYFPNFILQ